MIFPPRIIGGFEDKNGVREFLFALPRYAVDKVIVNILIAKPIYNHSRCSIIIIIRKMQSMKRENQKLVR